MPILPLRVQQSTSTTGTGTVALNAAAPGRRSYQDAYGTGTIRVAYVISGTSFFEIGYGDFDGGSPGNLTRVAVVASSNAGALVSLPVGTADVFPVIDPSERGLVTGTGNITLALTDIGNVVLWTGSAASSVSLPAAASVPAGRGWLIANGGSAALTIDPNGVETINNATTLVLSAGACVEVMRAGSVWIALHHIAGALPGLLASPPAIGGTTPAAGKFTSLAVTAGDINTSNGSVTLNRVGVDAVVSLNSVGGSGRAFTVGSANSGIFYIGDSTASVIRMTIDAAGNGAFGGALTVNGVLAAPTAAPGTNNTQVATTAFANAAAAAAAANSVKADVGNLQVRYGAFSATAGGSGDVTLSTPFPTVNLLVLICPTGVPGTNNAVAAYATSPGTFHWIWSSTTGGSFNMQYIALGY